jgi:hypothetical protein
MYNAKRYRLNGKWLPSINGYVPSSRELQAFWSAKTSDGRGVLQFNPYLRYVDGRDRLSDPSTDDLIQWAAHKWGIPEDWLRAEYVRESYWNGFQLGDRARVSPGWYRLYPFQSRVPNSLDVYESLGITQVKWMPDGSVGAGTERLRWESTAFSIDYQAATVRFYYDNPDGSRGQWGDRTYAPCEPWESIGGWFEPYPWGNGGQQQYIDDVRQSLRRHEWMRSSFVRWRAGSFPPGLSFG